MIVSEYVGEACNTLDQSIPTNITLPPGRWALSARSTIPVVGVQVGGRIEVLTWGETIDLASESAVVSKSFHAGDLVMTTASPGAQPTAPGAITIPADLRFDAAATNYVSRVVDVRGCVQAYLCMNAVVGDLDVDVTHKSFRTGAYGFRAWATDPTRGVVRVRVSMLQYSSMIPLGIGSGTNYDTTAPPPLRSLMETRPMALLDTLQTSMSAGQAGAAGFLKGGFYYADNFFLLVYR